jgi:hypothetical protein
MREVLLYLIVALLLTIGVVATIAAIYSMVEHAA